MRDTKYATERASAELDDCRIEPIFVKAENKGRIHKTLRVTPAMAAGLTNRLWDMSEIAEMIEATLPKAGRPATYKKRAV
jgi:hypothetical protein